MYKWVPLHSFIHTESFFQYAFTLDSIALGAFLYEMFVPFHRNCVKLDALDI